MKISAAIMTLFIFLSANLFADEAEETFIQANQAYRESEYEKAAAMYEKIINNGYVSKSLYYNLGNTYFKMKQIPRAILYYERALKLDPSDEDIQFNLQIANLRIIDKIEPVPRIFFEQWFDDLLKNVRSDVWAVFASVSLWAALALALIYIFGKSITMKKWTFAGGVLFILLFVILFFFAHIDYNRETSENEAIIFSPSVYVKSSPAEDGTDLFILHEGTKVYLLDRVGQWTEIRLADGNVGWIPESSFRII